MKASFRAETETLFESLKKDGWLTDWYTMEAAAACGLTGPSIMYWKQ